MIYQYVNRGKHLSLMVPCELVKGSDNSKEKFGLENWVPTTVNLSGTPSLYLKLLRTSQQVVPWLPIHSAKGGTSGRRGSDTTQFLVRWLQMKVIIKNRGIFRSSSGKQHNAFYETYQDGKTVQPHWKRGFILYFLPNLKWAIAFLPKRLKRAMKTKVLQSC